MQLRSSGKFFILIARSSLVPGFPRRELTHRPNREMLASFLSHADGAFGQIERPRPVGFEHARCRGPVSFPDIPEGMPMGKRRAVLAAIHERFQFIDVSCPAAS